MTGYSMQLSKTKCLFSNSMPNTYMYLENLLTWEVLSYFQKTPYLIEIHANLLKGVGGIKVPPPNCVVPFPQHIPVPIWPKMGVLGVIGFGKVLVKSWSKNWAKNTKLAFTVSSSSFLLLNCWPRTPDMTLLINLGFGNGCPVLLLTLNLLTPSEK